MLKRFNMRKSILFMGALLLAPYMTGCYSFGLYQTAQLLAPGHSSITPSISRQAFISGDNLDYTDGYSVVDVQVHHGLEKYEIGCRISRIGFEDGYQFVSFDPKISLVKDRLAFLLPIGFFFSDPFPSEVGSIDVLESIQIHPAFIASIPFGKRENQLNLALKGIIPLDSPADHVTGINIGLRFTPDEDEEGYALHPEIGLFTSAEGHYFFHWGMGFSYALGGP